MAGKLNGIGGHIEQSDYDRDDIWSASVHAMVREFEEEAGIKTPLSSWQCISIHHGSDYTINVFACINDDLHKVVSKTEEPVGVCPVYRVLLPMYKDELCPDVAKYITKAVFRLRRFSEYKPMSKQERLDFAREGYLKDLPI